MVDLMRGLEARFYGEPFVDRADISSEWASPTFELATDSLGVTESGALVACAQVARNHGFVTVDEGQVGRGIGTSLTAWTEQVLAGRGEDTVRQVVPVPDTAGAALMDDRGYDVAWAGWILRLDEGATIARRPLPDGVSIRAFEPADAEETHVVIEDAFGEWISRDRTTFEEWKVENLERDGGDLTHHRVAVADSRVVGASIVHDSDDTAWIYQLAVDRNHRGGGIAQELMAASFEAARSRGVPRAALGTDTRTGALGLYERLGMRVQATWHVWEKTLSPTGRDATA